MKKRKLDIYLLGLISTFIVLTSIEVLLRTYNLSLASGPEQDQFKALLLMTYLKQLFIPVLFSLYYLFLSNKTGNHSLVKLSWTLLLGISVINQLLTLDLNSFFYYGKSICLLIIIVLNLNSTKESV